MFGLVWSVGAATDGEGRRRFDNFLRCGQGVPVPRLLKLLMHVPGWGRQGRRCGHQWLNKWAVIAGGAQAPLNYYPNNCCVCGECLPATLPIDLNGPKCV